MKVDFSAEAGDWKELREQGPEEFQQLLNDPSFRKQLRDLAEKLTNFRTTLINGYSDVWARLAQPGNVSFDLYCISRPDVPGVTEKQRVEAATGRERRIARWEHEHVLEAVQQRLDEHPEKMRQRRETVEHPFGTIKARMGATHFLMKRLKNVRTEMALSVLAYNLTRVMNIMGIRPLIAAIRA
jgi:hypothetical protein